MPRTAIDVKELMNTPEGTVQVGDEFHDPDNWSLCTCGVDVPVDMDECWDCGQPVGHREGR